MSNFVSEAIIDETSANFDYSEADFEQLVETFQKEQPIVAGYLFSENMDVLTQTEREYMLFLVLIIWLSVKKVVGELPEFKSDELMEVEEANWIALEQGKGKDFRDRLNVFFEDTEQEDLLAFSEDALTDESTDVVSMEGRAPVFIALKTVIDVWTA